MYIHVSLRDLQTSVFIQASSSVHLYATFFKRVNFTELLQACVFTQDSSSTRHYTSKENSAFMHASWSVRLWFCMQASSSVRLYVSLSNRLYVIFFKPASLRKILQVCSFMRTSSSVHLYVSFFKHAALCKLLQACVSTPSFFKHANLLEPLQATLCKLLYTCVSKQASWRMWLYASFLKRASLRKFPQIEESHPILLKIFGEVSLTFPRGTF